VAAERSRQIVVSHSHGAIQPAEDPPFFPYRERDGASAV